MKLVIGGAIAALAVAALAPAVAQAQPYRHGYHHRHYFHHHHRPYFHHHHRPY